jgi:glycosyltransferase involved in cell wall biosynthesis
MRIAIVNKYLHVTGGADRHCRCLAQLLQERGHDVVLLSTATDDPPDLPAVFVSTSVTHDSRVELSLGNQARAAVRALWNSEAAAAMRRLIDEYRPEVVHAHKLYPQLSVAPVVVARRARIPVVQTLHDFELISGSPLDARGGWRDTDEARFRYRLLNSTTLPVRGRVHVPRVSVFISISRYVARIYASHGVESTTLPNFATNLPASTASPTFAERDGIAFVGRLRPEKGVADVVALAERLPDVSVTIAGSGSLDKYVAKSVAGLNNLTATGFIGMDKIDTLMRRARLVVVPSRWQEPAGLTAVEAMAQGTPVVAYANGGLAEYVADAGGGIIVPSDIESLVRACAELHSDAEAWAKLSRRAVAAVEGSHSRKGYGEQIERIYRGVL